MDTIVSKARVFQEILDFFESPLIESFNRLHIVHQTNSVAAVRGMPSSEWRSSG
jgi:hypothetical protein